MNRHNLKLTFMFTVMVFVVMNITMMILEAIAMILFRLGLLQPRSREAALLSFTISSAVLGTVISRVVGKRIISSIVEISNASKEVANKKYGNKL